jgi:HEAT repeat protein
LGEIAGTDEKAFQKVVAVLESDESVELRSAAGASLGKSGSSEAVEPLRKALLRGDFASRGAAVGLAELATSESIAVLKSAVIEGPNEARIAGVLALVRSDPSQCTDCRSFLLEQLTENDDEAVRDLVTIVLELPAKHEH